MHPNENSKCPQTSGKILRLKQGYNPNSSSMGSIIFALPVSLIAVTVGFGAISSIILSAFIHSDGKTGKDTTGEGCENE
jgi:hypothetical protein